ncbi:MAG: IclR family transcriptional regulator C-terminal domain-containing protein [Pseudorhodoplanes sp.]|uniref:IclR family transcriptional regulator domain-containing protein n=1 Tax=Pseudorhodoplanes sp. TaxID=1934341 RepID=UPI003D12A0C8
MPRIRRSEPEERLAETAGPEFLEALARGLRIIQTFGQDRRQLSLSDIAKLVGLPRASVRRTLHTLIHLGFAETDGRMFRLTPRVLMLAGAYLSSNPVSTLIQPALERLSTDIGEACSAAVLDGDDMVMIAHASPARVLQLSGQIGMRLPAVSSSLGRILLASFDDERLDALLSRVRPKPLTAQTVTGKNELRRAILRARAEGYSLVDQEVELGFRSISVALQRLDGKALGSLNVGAHTERGSLDTMVDRFLPKLRALAGELRQQLI